jgi:tetratricopeptide (TPR) repeat protein
VKKALKRQIKQDELVSGYASAGAWLRAHVEQVKIGVIGAVVLAVAAGGLLYFHGERARDSQRAFDEAHDLFVGAVGKPEEGAVAATKEEKYQKALAAFQGIAERYGSLAVGRRARYYAALCDIELGHRDKAESALRELADKQQAGAAGAERADLVLARLECAPGKYDQAIARYRKMLERPATVFPRDYVLMCLAEAFQEAGRLADAAATFRRVVDEMPASPFAEGARSRADYLKLATAKQG